MAEGRTCGSCSECCTVWGVPEIGKGKGVRCPHNVDVGCVIYARRPERCQGYECLWRVGAGVPADRPDKSGWVADFYGSERMLRVVGRTEARPPGWVSELLDRADAENRTAEVHRGERVWLIQPKRRVETVARV